MDNEERFVLLDETYLPQMAELYKSSFAGEPWNDDWSNSEQLNQYIKEISCSFARKKKQKNFPLFILHSSLQSPFFLSTP